MKTILFDMDGTIVDSGMVWRTTFNEMRKKAGLSEFDETEYAEKVAGTPMESETLFFPGRSIEEIKLDYGNAFKERTDLLNPMANFEYALEKIQAYKIGVVSNTPQELVDFILEKLDLYQKFHVVIGSRPDKKGKPNPDLINLAIEELKSDPLSTVFVGDTQYDVAAAMAAGCKSISFRFDGGSLRIDNMSQLPDAVKILLETGR
ncbi:HAD family hydrolase [Candidatus Woesearchaeota archaeon]|nr:HAD family hydrolase [Candidatus Woesearchaeota archaeon]